MQMDFALIVNKSGDSVMVAPDLKEDNRMLVVTKPVMEEQQAWKLLYDGCTVQD
jgi:hypothetical protein